MSELLINLCGTCGHADLRHTWKDGSRKLAPHYGRCEAKKCLCWRFVEQPAKEGGAA